MTNITATLGLLLLLAGSNEISAQEIAFPKPVKVYQKDGVSVNSYDYKSFEPFLNIKNDTTYVFNFWATWCRPCIEELPHFEKINTAYKSKKIKVVLVSLDMKKQVESSLIPFIKRKALQSEVVLLNDPDANSWISKIDPAWSGALPATLIYNKDKRWFYEQSFTYEALEKEIKQITNN